MMQSYSKSDRTRLKAPIALRRNCQVPPFQLLLPGSGMLAFLICTVDSTIWLEGSKEHGISTGKFVLPSTRNLERDFYSRTVQVKLTVLQIKFRNLCAETLDPSELEN
eukprot:25556-Rhodomonas_salina.2